MQWLFNAPFSLSWDHFSNFFGKIWSLDLWLTLILSNLGFVIAILIPGLALSYALQPAKLSRGLRICFGLALGFVFPLLLFYVLGAAHLYYKAVWVGASALLSGLLVWKFRRKFLDEWKAMPAPTSVSAAVYGLLVLYFLISYIAFFVDGIMDYDILFGQVAPAVHLFFEHVYRPFDMGAIPIVRHELFPGPISMHSAFMMFGTTPWVAASAVMVFLAPMMLMMIGKFSDYLFKKSEYLVIFMSLVTFLGFRIKNARGTVLALIFLFGFLLLPQIYEQLHAKADAKLKNILKPVVATALMVALSLYTNIEIGAILLGIMGLVFAGSWLTGRRVLMKTVLFGISFGFLLYAPWFVTVALLAFKQSLLLMLALYAGLAVLAACLTLLPKPEVSSNLLERILLVLMIAGAAVAAYAGDAGSLFRLPDALRWLTFLSAIPLVFFAWRKPDFDKHSFFIYSWFFAILFVAVYPRLSPAAAQIGLPENLQYFLFDKELGSVFPELRAKIQEYFLPIFDLILLGGTLAWSVKNWLWKKWTLAVFITLFLFFTSVRFVESDYEEYPRGQTISSMVYYWLATQYAYDERPIWLKPQAEQIMKVLDEVKKPGDKIFSFYAIYNPYYPEDIYPYLMTGVGTVGLNKEDLVSDQYTIELLDQVIAAGANYAVIMPGTESPQIWFDDERVKIAAKSEDGTYMLLSF